MLSFKHLYSEADRSLSSRTKFTSEENFNKEKYLSNLLSAASSAGYVNVNQHLTILQGSSTNIKQPHH